MAAYSDKDRALVYAELSVNDGNIKRTSRNIGIPTGTIRRWRDDWARNGVPDTLNAEITLVATDFLSEAIRIRGKLMERLEFLLDNDKVSSREVVTAIGILSDKIRAYEALEQVQKVEHTFTLPPAEDLRELFVGMLSGVVEAAQLRAAQIEALEEPAVVTTYRELPSGS
jgi:transposase-like protein